MGVHHQAVKSVVCAIKKAVQRVLLQRVEGTTAKQQQKGSPFKTTVAAYPSSIRFTPAVT
jgi:hypothetical protein